jgi:hypothetical protein
MRDCVSFLGVKAAREGNWPLTSNWCLGEENIYLYIHSPIPLHGVRTNTPRDFTFTQQGSLAYNPTAWRILVVTFLYTGQI